MASRWALFAGVFFFSTSSLPISLLISLTLLSRDASATHIVAILADDFGWADAGWHRPAGYAEVETPRMDELVRD